MAAGNAFVNGFMGGMGAMNQMIDSKARREHMAWQKELVMEDREIEAQERDYINQERQRAEGLREISAIGHWYENTTPENRKSVETKLYDVWRTNPGIAAWLDNDNPAERREFSHLKPAHDKQGNQIGWTPVANIYDITGDKEKLIRTGDFTENGANGGRPLYISNEDFIGAMAGPNMADTRLALQTEMLRLGGTLPEAKPKYGDLTVRHGMVGQFEQNSNKFTPYNTGSKSGSGSGSGSKGWKKFDAGDMVDKSDPSGQKMVPYEVERKDNGDGTYSTRTWVYDPESGHMKVADVRTDHFPQPGSQTPPPALQQPGTGGNNSGLGALFPWLNAGNTQQQQTTPPQLVDAQPGTKDVENPPKEKPAVKPKKKPIAEKIATSPRKTVGSHGYGAYQPSAETRQRGLEPFKNYMKEQSKLRDELAEKKRIEEMEELIKLARAREKSRLGGMQ